jgi:hypothetical protein
MATPAGVARIAVTAAQRARLVVALGIVNLVLAGVAFGVGVTSDPTVTPVIEPGPVAIIPTPSPNATGSPEATPAPTPQASVPGLEPAATPSATPTPSPTVEPSNPVTAVVPTPGQAEPGAGPQAPAGPGGPDPRPTPPVPAAPTRPRPTPTPAATPAPTPSATAAPTPAPTPAATPAATPQTPPAATPAATPPTPAAPTPLASPETVGDGHPPCPSDGAPPPGHNKGGDPQERPCKGGKSDHGDTDKGDKGKDDKGKGGAGDAAGGMLLMPLGFVGSATIWVRVRATRQRTDGWLRGRRRAR